MQASNFFKKILWGSFTAILGFSLFAQSMEMPSMPVMPEMPAVSNPSLDGAFYKPSMPVHGNVKNQEEKKSAANSTTSSILKDATTTDNIMSSFLNTNPNLTATDISTLYDSGLFSNLSSLTSLTGNAGIAGDVENTALLRQILTSLEELKVAQNNASPAEKITLANYQQDAETFKQREPEILRFKINGYSVTESFTKVFFSEPEPDGSFLLTADRRYYANQKIREETVYILFKAIKSRGSSVQYEVQPSLVQTVKNEQSYLYKLSHIKNLVAEKTGNLVTMHTSEDDVTVDLLLDIDILNR